MLNFVKRIANAAGRHVLWPTLATAAVALTACGGGGGGSSEPVAQPQQPGATLSLSATSGTVAAGASTTATATIVRSGGFTGDVTLGSSGAGTGLTITGGPIAANATTATLTLTASADAPFGTNALNITASASGVTVAPVSYNLTVRDPARTGPIAAAFPRTNGIYQLPDYPSTRQLTWVLAQLAAGSTSLTDINARFTPQALASTSAANWQTLLQQMRTTSPNAVVVDLVALTPVAVTALIGTPGSPNTGRYLQLTTRYAGSGLINSMSAATFALNGSVQFAADSTLTMAQAADKFLTLSPSGSILVARVNNRQCTAIEQRNATTPRATGSIFKNWVLGATAQALQDGAISPTATVPLVAANTVRGSLLAAEPVGTVFPLADMATLMMGNSDNSATDHLMQLLGRSRTEAQLLRSNHANAALMTPFLTVNEQFNLFSGVTQAAAEAYTNGTEAFQRNYADTVLAPLGPVTGSGFNTSVIITGSWQSSAMDVCAAYAGMRRFADGSEALKLIDRALSSGVAQPFVRNEWERVWYKGGSLVSGAIGNMVYAHSWLLESEARGTYVVVALANNQAGGIDEFQMQSVTGRILQLVRGL
jgi:beta-lactamase class A